MDKKRMKGQIIAVIVLLLCLVYGGFALTRDVVGLGGADYKRKNGTTFEYKKGKIGKEADHFLITMREQEMEVGFAAEDYHVTLTFPDGTSLNGYYAGGDLVDEKGLPLYMNDSGSQFSVTVYGDIPDLSEISYYNIGCELSRIYFDDFVFISFWVKCKLDVTSASNS